MILLRGDFVKFSENVFKEKVEKAKEKASIQVVENNFEVETVSPDGKEVVMYGDVVNLKNGAKEIRRFRSDKKLLELTKGVQARLEFSMRFADYMNFNEVGSEVLDRLRGCNIRESGKSYLDVITEKDKEPLLSYITTAKIQTLSQESTNMYKEPCRQTGKPIKIINEILRANNKKELSQKEIDGVLGALQQHINAEFKIVEGKDITKYYNVKNYVKGGGSLNGSCMRYDYINKIPDFFKIYEDNAKMLILQDNNTGKIYGRAIIWEDVALEFDDTEVYLTVMDRIYTTQNSLVELFKDYAEEHDMMYPICQEPQTESWKYKGNKYHIGGDDYRLRFELKQAVYKYGIIPYLDTAVWCYNMNTNLLYSESEENDWELSGITTSGNWNMQYDIRGAYCRKLAEENIETRGVEVDRDDVTNLDHIRKISRGDYND